MIDDLLTRLPDAGYPSTVRPLPKIMERAHEIRRGRRRYRVGAVAGSAAVVTALSFGGLTIGGGSIRDVFPSSGSSENDCTPGGNAYVEQLARMPQLAFLPSVASAGPLTGPVLPRRQTDDCPFEPPQAVAFSVSVKSETVTRRLEIGPADAPNRYGAPGMGFGGLITRAVVDGQPAEIYGDPDQSWLYMFWVATDGTNRSLDSSGLSRKQLVEVAKELTFGDQGKVAETLPDGFDTWAVLPAMPTGPRTATESRYVAYAFYAEGGDSDAPGWDFQVHDRPSYDVAELGGRQVQIGTAGGWWDPAWGGTKGVGRLVWSVDGVELSLSGAGRKLTLDQALAVARSVTKVAPTDPRIVAAGQN